MSIHCFTSLSLSYLSRARVLGHSLRRFQPDWTLWLCITDRAPAGFTFDLRDEPFDRVIWTDTLDPVEGKAWLFKHDVVEACTAVKGALLTRLLSEGAEKVFYLDPDIAVFAPLTPLAEMLETNDLLLTPHLLEPDTLLQAIVDNEVETLDTGAFNLGFLGVSNTDRGRRFAEWWSDRLRRLCYDDRPNGIFVDQKWCDLVPAFFDGVGIIKDPGYNVASWNLSRRKISITSDGLILANGHTLRFFHFSKLGPLGDVMTQRYARDNVEVYEIWSWYRRTLERCKISSIPDNWWHYGFFSNGAPIPKRARIVYRQSRDLEKTFPDPFSTGLDGGFFEWYQANATD
jgi:hypothetical protein